MNKIKFKGLSNIGYEGIIKENADYLVSILMSADGIYTPPTLGEAEVPLTFHLRANRIEQIVKVGDSKPLKITQGSSPSKRLRNAILAWATRLKKDDPEAFYEAQMIKLTELVNNKDL